jgi:hypothetical protein
MRTSTADKIGMPALAAPSGVAGRRIAREEISA